MRFNLKPQFIVLQILNLQFPPAIFSGFFTFKSILPIGTIRRVQMKNTSFISAGVVALAITNFAGAEITTLDITALIDGRDQLIISNNSIQWHHFDYAAVGRHEGRNEATIITMTRGNITYLDQLNWTPTWSEPAPNEIRFEDYSSIFTGLVPNLPRVTDVTLIAVEARSAMSIFQLPNQNNNFTTILEFNDNGPNGSAWYHGIVTFTYIPSPGAAALIGLSGLLMRRRSMKGGR
jgi:hypothetical protein